MLSIMFTDIEGFTKLSEGMDSDDLARLRQVCVRASLREPEVG